MVHAAPAGRSGRGDLAATLRRAPRTRSHVSFFFLTCPPCEAPQDALPAAAPLVVWRGALSSSTIAASSHTQAASSSSGGSLPVSTACELRTSGSATARQIRATSTSPPAPKVCHSGRGMRAMRSKHPNQGTRPTKGKEVSELVQLFRISETRLVK